MKPSVKVTVIKEKSFDPNFYVRVSYADGTTTFTDQIITLVRLQPKVRFIYPDEVTVLLNQIDQQRLELEMLNCVMGFIMGNAGRANIITPKL